MRISDWSSDVCSSDLYDTNLPIVFGGDQVYGAKTNAYWLVNLDARVNLEFLGLNDQTFFQLNVYNLFDTLYVGRSEEHTSELQSLMRISYAVFCLKKKKKTQHKTKRYQTKQTT